jgi:hypothetical protein
VLDYVLKGTYCCLVLLGTNYLDLPSVPKLAATESQLLHGGKIARDPFGVEGIAHSISTPRSALVNMSNAGKESTD